MPTPDAEHERDSSLVPLKRPLSLRETVLEQLRTAIITGRLAEGEVVSAPALGVTLGVSATPVREAMMDLAREGLVETLKNKGFRVTTMSESDLDDLAQIRLLLEPPAMRLIAGRVPEADLPKLRSLADACLEATDRGDLEEYLRFDREFHALVLSYTGNAQLVELATSLRRRTRLYGIGTLSREGRLADSAREHHELIDLLATGDGAGAERVLARHVAHARTLWATGRDQP
ncbi:GntR family transcriptional regulator [Leucobacter manosquensis]|uniref:GntR family transcriptional regulator n=1 Tax=Leucobacter manosquensis TaxID=2810611 RepID=A0ABS5M0B7_9MICO|nr:GntR family transcriptional regulator [Leucobacter manosquensis]MBS3180643.1 GntR family transcriptional regulator [Leucobacter manosquensis]